jgi:hypothetical protein
MRKGRAQDALSSRARATNVQRGRKVADGSGHVWDESGTCPPKNAPDPPPPPTPPPRFCSLCWGFFWGGGGGVVFFLGSLLIFIVDI